MEKKYFVKMAEEDYEDKKANRYSNCTLQSVPVTPEAKLKTRIIEENERASKVQKLDHSKPKPSLSFQDTKEETQQSDVGVSETLSSDNDPDPDYIGDDTSEQNRTKLQTLAKVCDRC